MERDLFDPIKEYFEKKGYICDGEVEDIDLFAERSPKKENAKRKKSTNYKGKERKCYN